MFFLTAVSASLGICYLDFFPRKPNSFLSLSFLVAFFVCKPANDVSTMRADWDFFSVDGFPLCKKRRSLPLDAYTSVTVIDHKEQNKSPLSVQYQDADS